MDHIKLVKKQWAYTLTALYIMMFFLIIGDIYALFHIEEYFYDVYQAIHSVVMFLISIAPLVGIIITKKTYMKRLEDVKAFLGYQDIDEYLDKCECIGEMQFFGEEEFISLERPFAIRYSDIKKVVEFGSNNKTTSDTRSYQICIIPNEGKNVLLTSLFSSSEKVRPVVACYVNLHKMIKLFSEKGVTVESTKASMIRRYERIQ